jgi:hypothetical protein
MMREARLAIRKVNAELDGPGLGGVLQDAADPFGLVSGQASPPLRRSASRLRYFAAVTRVKERPGFPIAVH